MTAPIRARRLKRLALAAVLALAPLALASASSAIPLDLIPVKADPGINEYSPSASGDWTAWSANSESQPDYGNAFVQQAGHPKRRLNPSGTYGDVGGFDGTTLVWTQFSNGHAGDIWRIDLATGNRARFGRSVNTQYGEFLPTISGKWLLFTRFDSDDNRFRVVLFNKSTGHSRVLAVGPRSNGVFSGQVNGSYATWFRVSSDKSDVFRYNIATGATAKMPRSKPFAYTPMLAADGTVYFVTSNDGCGANVDLRRYPVDGPVEKLRDFPHGIDVWFGSVDDRTDGTRQVYLGRADCSRNKTRMLDTYKFVDRYTLSVTKAGTGSGTVTSNPAGIDCGLDCSGVFARGTTVTLTATPDLGSFVTGWSVASCGTSTECTVDVETNQTVTVTFGLTP